MVQGIAATLLLCLAAVTALPAEHIISKLGNELRFQYAKGPDGSALLVDSWLKTSDVPEVGRYNPDAQNIYHLFTRQNPVVSQPLLTGVDGLLGLTNYNAQRRTVVLLHGWMEGATADLNSVLVPAFLAAEDLNIIVVDWSAGADTLNYLAAVSNTVAAGESVARFVDWLNRASNGVALSYHLVGHSLGGHMAGVVGRNVDGDVAYITGLDPSFYLWIFNSNKLRPDDSLYTEVIHTNAGVLGYLGTLGHADFYPNGGVNMPGCGSQQCDHERSFFYLAESLVSGGFNGQRCATYITAMTGTCILWGNLNMGGLVPKIGSRGIYWMQTNANPPFSRG